MSGLIPAVNWTDFQKMVKEGKAGELKSCEVLFNGEHLFTAVIPHGDEFTKDFAKIRAEQLALRSNIAGGKDPDELLGKAVTA